MDLSRILSSASSTSPAVATPSSPPPFRPRTHPPGESSVKARPTPGQPLAAPARIGASAVPDADPFGPSSPLHSVSSPPRHSPLLSSSLFFPPSSIPATSHLQRPCSRPVRPPAPLPPPPEPSVFGYTINCQPEPSDAISPYLHFTQAPPPSQHASLERHQSSTNTPLVANMPSTIPRKRSRRESASSSGGAQRKEYKRNNFHDAGQSASASGTQIPNTQEIEAIDLCEVDDEDDLAKTLQKQREDAVRSQNSVEQTSGTKLSGFTCTICLSEASDITTTVCGHAYCRMCLINWLKQGEHGQAKRPNCPACRKPIRRQDKNQLITLEIMVKPRHSVGKKRTAS